MTAEAVALRAAQDHQRRSGTRVDLVARWGNGWGWPRRPSSTTWTNILSKLQVRSRVEAALLVAREGPPQKG
jgi:hypothetical protein